MDITHSTTDKVFAIVAYGSIALALIAAVI